MKTDPLFSIVIPTYNRADLISETLDSVLQQSYKHFEVIIVDNRSTDNTLEVLEPYLQSDKIRLIVNAENFERSRSRNVGMANAKGDYLTLLDSDDFMYPNSLSDAVEFIKKGMHTDFFHNHYELVDRDRKRLYKYHFPKESQHIKRLARGNFLSCIGVFLSRSVYTQFKFSEDEKVLGSEDWEYWIRIMSQYPLGVIPKINCGIRSHDARSISNYEVKAVAERKKYIIDQLLEIPKVNEVFGPYENQMRAFAYLFTAISANQSGSKKDARKYLLKSLKTRPLMLFNRYFLRNLQISYL